jgi:hypothetical protein
MTDDTKPTSRPDPGTDPVEPVRGPESGIQVPDSASERHLREAAEHVKPPPEDVPRKRPSADRDEIAEPWKPEK